jgi:hypothetical protein
MPWTHYTCKSKERPSVVSIRTDFADGPPRADLVCLYRVCIWMNPELLPEKEFRAAVEELGQDSLVYSHQISRPDQTEYFFYGTEGLPLRDLPARLPVMQGMRIEVDSRPDPGWQEYRTCLGPVLFVAGKLRLLIFAGFGAMVCGPLSGLFWAFQERDLHWAILTGVAWTLGSVAVGFAFLGFARLEEKRRIKLVERAL